MVYWLTLLFFIFLDRRRLSLIHFAQILLGHVEGVLPRFLHVPVSAGVTHMCQEATFGSAIGTTHLLKLLIIINSSNFFENALLNFLRARA